MTVVFFMSMVCTSCSFMHGGGFVFFGWYISAAESAFALAAVGSALELSKNSTCTVNTDRCLSV